MSQKQGVATCQDKITDYHTKIFFGCYWAPGSTFKHRLVIIKEIKMFFEPPLYIYIVNYTYCLQCTLCTVQLYTVYFTMYIKCIECILYVQFTTTSKISSTTQNAKKITRKHVFKQAEADGLSILKTKLHNSGRASIFLISFQIR